jgi:hypothetical protein
MTPSEHPISCIVLRPSRSPFHNYNLVDLTVSPHCPRPIDFLYSVSTLDAGFVWADGMAVRGVEVSVSFQLQKMGLGRQRRVLTSRMVEDALRNMHLPPHLHNERPLSPPLFANLPPTFSPRISSLQRCLGASHRPFPPTIGASELRTAIS